MTSALEIYDIFQTLGICSFLVITIPTASYVYYKLLFFRPFSENYTFKLLVMNGITVGSDFTFQGLLSCVVYLFVNQLTSFPFMSELYFMLQETDLVTPLRSISKN